MSTPPSPPNPLQQVTDALRQVSQQAPQIAQQLSAIAQPFAHGLPPPPPPAPPPSPVGGTTTEALLLGVGAVVVVGVAAYFLGRSHRPVFGALKLDPWEMKALRTLGDPSFKYSDEDPDAPHWDAAFEGLKAKGLLYVKPTAMKLSEWEWRALKTLRDPNFTYDDKDPYAFLWDEAFSGLEARGLMRVVWHGNDRTFEITPAGEDLETMHFVPTERAKRLLAGADEDAPIPSTDRTPAYPIPPSMKKYSVAWAEAD